MRCKRLLPAYHNRMLYSELFHSKRSHLLLSIAGGTWLEMVYFCMTGSGGLSTPASRHDSNVLHDGIYNGHNSMRGKSFFNSIIIFRGHQHICSLWLTDTLLCSSCLYYNCCIFLSRVFLPFLSLLYLAGTPVPTVWDSLFWPTLLQS